MIWHKRRPVADCQNSLRRPSPPEQQSTQQVEYKRPRHHLRGQNEEGIPDAELIQQPVLQGHHHRQRVQNLRWMRWAHCHPRVPDLIIGNLSHTDNQTRIKVIKSA